MYFFAKNELSGKIWKRCEVSRKPSRKCCCCKTTCGILSSESSASFCQFSYVHPNPASEFFCIFLQWFRIIFFKLLPFFCEIFAVVFLVEFSHYFFANLFAQKWLQFFLCRSKNSLFSTFLVRLRFQGSIHCLEDS